MSFKRKKKIARLELRSLKTMFLRSIFQKVDPLTAPQKSPTEKVLNLKGGGDILTDHCLHRTQNIALGRVRRLG